MEQVKRNTFFKKPHMGNFAIFFLEQTDMKMWKIQYDSYTHLT